MPLKESYGQTNRSVLDVVGGYLSTRNLIKTLNKLTIEHNTLLDIGCGYEAKISQNLHNKFKSVALMDFSIKNFQSDNIKYILGDAKEMVLKIPANSIDLVIANNFIEHISEDVDIVKNLYRILKVNGVLYINVPSWRGKVFLEFAAFKLNKAPYSEMDDHKHYYTKRKLWSLCVNSGFRPSHLRVMNKKFALNTASFSIKCEDTNYCRSTDHKMKRRS